MFLPLVPPPNVTGISNFMFLHKKIQTDGTSSVVYAGVWGTEEACYFDPILIYCQICTIQEIDLWLSVKGLIVVA